jgi:recA bacterial DNA recombination protein
VPALPFRKKLLEDLLAEQKLVGARSVHDSLFEPEGRVTGTVFWNIILGQGFRKGSVGEIVGSASSGRTALALALAAHVSREDLVAWIDPLDRFSPQAALHAGVLFRNFVWLRGTPSKERSLADAIGAAHALAAASLFDIVVLDFADLPERLLKALPTAWNMRLLHAFETTETACVVLTRSHWGASPRGLSIRLRGVNRLFVQTGRGRLLKRVILAATQSWPFLKNTLVDLEVRPR